MTFNAFFEDRVLSGNPELRPAGTASDLCIEASRMRKIWKLTGIVTAIDNEFRVDQADKSEEASGDGVLG